MASFRELLPAGYMVESQRQMFIYRTFLTVHFQKTCRREVRKEKLLKQLHLN